MSRLFDIMSRAAGPYRDRWRRHVAAVTVAAVLQGLAFLLLLPIMRALVDGRVVQTRWLLTGLVALLIIEAVIRIRGDRVEDALPDIVAHLRHRLGAKLRTMPAEELGRRRTGDLAVLLGQDVMNAVLAVGEVAATFLRLVIVPAVVLAGLTVVDWRLALAAVVAGLFAVPGLTALRRRIAAGLRPVSDADTDSASRVVEYVQALPVLKAADQVGTRSERLVRALENQGKHLNETQRRLTGPLLVIAVAAELAVIAVVTAGLVLTLGAELDLALFVAVVVAAVRFAEPITQAGAMTGVFELADQGLRRIDELLAVENLPAPDEPVAIDAHDLAFDQVRFSYRDQPEAALDNVSFTVPERSLTALVGPSGGGKSTVLRLLTRYADPQAGAVRIGGADLRDVEPRALMRHVAVVYQDVYLFDTTIADNVRMARPDATNDEVADALQRANCGPLLSRLPDGLHTPVGEIGNRLSGGERQRIAIARALLKDAPIVLLDEPTSALDADSEVALQDAIDQLVADRTVLVIAHRLSTVVAADQILVLDDGRITQRGTHEHLLATEGRYARMWQAQTAARHWSVPA